jgi:hypothetical protein
VQPNGKGLPVMLKHKDYLKVESSCINEKAALQLSDGMTAR